MTLLATIAGIGFWAPGLPTWADARAFARDGSLPDAPPARPVADLLPPNERRRAPDTVAVALAVARAACEAADRDPRTLPSVFASTHGDLAITDYMGTTLASEPTAISPTRFHNSVHNAAAGYWTIGAGAMAPATAISALDATFAQGLLEAAAMLATDADAVLLVAYDNASTGPLAQVTRSEGLLGAALVLTRDGPGIPLALQLGDGDAPTALGALGERLQGNASAPMLALFDALALDAAGCTLKAGPGRVLSIAIGG